MIRVVQKTDITKVADIWLDTNIKAHNFIPAEYWKSNFKSVKEALLLAEVYVYEYDTEIQGFIGLNDEYVEGIFRIPWGHNKIILDKCKGNSAKARDDEQSGDSNSIINQKKMLEKYATEQGFTNLLYYFVF